MYTMISKGRLIMDICIPSSKSDSMGNRLNDLELEISTSEKIERVRGFVVKKVWDSYIGPKMDSYVGNVEVFYEKHDVYDEKKQKVENSFIISLIRFV